MFASRIFYGLLFICIAVVGVACENDPNEVAALGKKVNEVEEAHDVVGRFTQAADLKAELKAPLMYRVKADSPYAEFPKSIYVEFYKDKHVVESTVKAKYAKYYELGNKVYLRDSIVVFNNIGDTLFCDDLWWDQNAGTFYTDEPVLIHTPTQYLRGTGLWSLSNFTNYIIKNPVGLVDIPEQIQP